MDFPFQRDTREGPHTNKEQEVENNLGTPRIRWLGDIVASKATNKVSNFAWVLLDLYGSGSSMTLNIVPGSLEVIEIIINLIGKLQSFQSRKTWIVAGAAHLNLPTKILSLLWSHTSITVILKICMLKHKWSITSILEIWYSWYS